MLWPLLTSTSVYTWPAVVAVTSVALLVSDIAALRATLENMREDAMLSRRIQPAGVSSKTATSVNAGSDTAKFAQG
jgi:hypothetical protein